MPLICDTHPGEPTIEIVAAGPITETDVKVAAQKVKGFIDRHGEINVIEVVRDFSGTDPALVWSALSTTPRLGRVAIVSDAGWLSPLAAARSAELRTYPMDRIDAARIWAHRGR